jgi:MerR family transcriptional regulator/heat shock protein HspR
MQGRYTMAVVVKLSGLPAHYLRKLDKAGILNPYRTPGGTRLYTDEEVKKIKKIACLKETGVNLAGISAIMTENERAGDMPSGKKEETNYDNH